MPSASHSWNQIYYSSPCNTLTSRVRIPPQLQDSEPRFKDLHLDADMDKYKRHQQHELAFRRRKPVDYDRRTEIKRGMATADNNHNDSSGRNSNSTSSSLNKQPQLHRRRAEYRGRSPRLGFEPRAPYKPYTRGPSLWPQRSVNANNSVDWRLAWFMSHEYPTRGTLLGRPWPPQDSNSSYHGINDKSKSKSVSLDQYEDESKREKETLYHTLTDSIRAGDVHLPGIVNPSQLAAWLGLD